jgi:hypothetical protein
MGLTSSVTYTKLPPPRRQAGRARPGRRAGHLANAGAGDPDLDAGVAGAFFTFWSRVQGCC